MKQPRVYVYRDAAGRWRWHFRAANGRTLADSGQSYTRRIDAVTASETVTGGLVECHILDDAAEDGAVKYGGILKYGEDSGPVLPGYVFTDGAS